MSERNSNSSLILHYVETFDELKMYNKFSYILSIKKKESYILKVSELWTSFIPLTKSVIYSIVSSGHIFLHKSSKYVSENRGTLTIESVSTSVKLSSTSNIIELL